LSDERRAGRKWKARGTRRWFVQGSNGNGFTWWRGQCRPAFCRVQFLLCLEIARVRIAVEIAAASLQQASWMNCVRREERSVLLVDERRGEAGRQEGRERAGGRAGEEATGTPWHYSAANLTKSQQCDQWQCTTVRDFCFVAELGWSSIGRFSQIWLNSNIN
jgi:hypothetical protein